MSGVTSTKAQQIEGSPSVAKCKALIKCGLCQYDKKIVSMDSYSKAFTNDITFVSHNSHCVCLIVGQI